MAAGPPPSLQDATLEVLALAAGGRLLPSRAPAALQALLPGEELMAPTGPVQAAAADAAWLLWLDLGEVGAVAEGEEGGSEAWRRRLLEAVQALLAAGLLSKPKLLESGEPDFLAAVGVIACPEAFRKQMLKINTRTFYVQEKYNLLCEESEGFAKLIVALYQFAAHSERESDAGDRGDGGGRGGGGCAVALGTLKRHVESLIGQFLLDPNRVLDLILEVLEDFPRCSPLVQLAEGFKSQSARYFIGFKAGHYHAASRNAAAAEVGPGPEAASKAGDGGTRQESLDAVAGGEDATKSASPKERHVVHRVPMALYDAAGALVKAGLASRAEIQELLQPDLGTVLEIAAEGLEEQGRRVRKIGAVSLAGLGGGRAHGATAKNLEMPNLRQKGGLSAAGLEMEGGAYNTVFSREGAEQDQQVSNQHFGLCCGALNVQDWPTALALLQDFRDEYHVAPAADPGVAHALCAAISELLEPVYIEYFPESEDNKAETATRGENFVSKISAAALQLLDHLGLHLYRDLRLMAKLSRILRHEILIASKSGAARGTAHEVAEGLLRRSLLPALSLVPANPALAHEVWSVLELLPYSDRFRVYNQVIDDSESEPVLQAAEKLASVGVRKIMRRVTKPSNDKKEKEVMKQMGRMLAKLGHGSPLAAMRTIVQQVEAYEAMTGPVVDALRFFSPLGFDVLTFTIIMRFVTGGREKIKEDGVSIADWFQNLASFTGQLCKKYSGLDLTALCQYVANQLKDGETVDLLVLKELISKMALIDTLEDLSDSQIESLAGGETLRLEALLSQLHRASPKPVQKCVRRLRAALFGQGGRNQQLAVPLLILIAQQKLASVFTAETRHLKLLGEIVDRCNEVFIQYSALLWTALQPSSHYDQVLPTMEKLHTNFGLPPEAVFHLYRPLISAEDVAGRGAGVAAGAEKDGSGSGSVDRKFSWEDLCEAARPVVPASVPPAMHEFYFTFWSLSLYDVYFPEKRYVHEVDSLRAQASKLLKASDSHKISPEESSQLLRERDKHKGVMEAIEQEKEAHVQHVRAVRKALERSKNAWFAGGFNLGQFLQHCLFPRVIFSPGEALYCAKFIEVVHGLSTPGFDMFSYLLEMTAILSQMVFSCTQNEAARLGIFLKETLRLLNTWASNDETFQALRTAEVFRSGDDGEPAATEGAQRQITREELMKIVVSLNEQLVVSLTSSLQSAEYMEVRNALQVLTKIVKHFPSNLEPTERSLDLAGRVRDCAAKVRDEDVREDLKTLARCYLGMLQGKVQELRRLLPATPAPDAEEPGNNAAMSSGEDGELMPEDAVREGGTTEAVAAGHGEVQTVIAKKKGNAGEASVEKKPRKRSPKDKRRKEGDDNCRICGEPGHWARSCPREALKGSTQKGGTPAGGPGRNSRGSGQKIGMDRPRGGGDPRSDRGMHRSDRGTPRNDRGGEDGGAGGSSKAPAKRKREEDRHPGARGDRLPPPSRGDGRTGGPRGQKQPISDRGGGAQRRPAPRDGGRAEYEHERGRPAKRPREGPSPHGDDRRGGSRDQRRRPWK